MANVNTIAFATQLPGSAQGASSTSEIQFNNSAGNAAVLTVGAGYLKNRSFRIKAGGKVTGGTTTNFTAKIYTGAALGSAVLSSGAVAVNSASANWELVFEGVIDSASNKLQGHGVGNVNATLVALANGSVSSIDPTLAQSFSASLQFSASNASNAATLEYFEIEAL